MHICAWRVNCGCVFVGILVGDWVCCHCVLMSDRPPPFSLWPHWTCSPSQKPLKRQCKRQQQQWHGPISDSSISSLSRKPVKSQCGLQRQQWIGPPIRAVSKACAVSLLSPTDRCHLCCANPVCVFKVHYSADYGGFCCIRCFFHYAVGLTSHGRRCAGIAACPSDTRVVPMSPLLRGRRQ